MRKNLGCLIAIGAIAIPVWLILSWSSLVVVLVTSGMIVSSIFYLKKWRRQRKLAFEENQKRLELEEFKLEKERLLSEGTYKYVESFVKNYSMVKSEDEIWKLKELIGQKGFVFSRTQIGWLIDEEIKRREYKEFTSKVGFGNPQDLDSFISNLIDRYGENWTRYREFFTRLLTEHNIPFEESQLEAQIHDVRHRAEITRFESRLASSNTSGNSVHELDSMAGTEFEAFLKDLFEKMGYIAETTLVTHDQGADLILKRLGEITVVQAKRWSAKVTNAAVQEVVAAVRHYGAHKGMVVTTSEFTDSALDLAKSNSIELIDRTELQRLINNYYPNVATRRDTTFNVTVKRKEVEQ